MRSSTPQRSFSGIALLETLVWLSLTAFAIGLLSPTLIRMVRIPASVDGTLTHQHQAQQVAQRLSREAWSSQRITLDAEAQTLTLELDGRLIVWTVQSAGLSRAERGNEQQDDFVIQGARFMSHASEVWLMQEPASDPMRDALPGSSARAWLLRSQAVLLNRHIDVEATR